MQKFKILETLADVVGFKIYYWNWTHNFERLVPNLDPTHWIVHQLYNRYGNWKLVCGCYNTGRPLVNGYASFCVNNKNYQKNWVYIKGI